MNVDELVSKLQDINIFMSNGDFLKKQNGDTLSYTAVKLAAMKALLIDAKDDALKAMLGAEVLMDGEKAGAYARALETGTATAAKDLKYSDEKYKESRIDYGKYKAAYEKLKSVTADTHDLIEAIRSRIIDLQQSRKDESIK